MNISVKKSALEVAVKNLVKVISQKASLPILSDILFEINSQAGSARLTASDNETWVTYSVLLEGVEGEETRFCVNARIMWDMIANLVEQQLFITLGEDMKLTIGHKDGYAFCMAEGADAYPLPVSTGDSQYTAEVDTATINRTLRRSAWATEKKSELRPALMGVNFAFSGGNLLEVVATDGHLMMKSSEAVSGNSQPFSFIMPGKVAEILPAMLTSEIVKLSYDGRACCMVSGDMVFRFLCIDATYPKYAKIIPYQFEHEVTIGRKTLANALHCICPFTNTGSNLARMEFSGSLELIGENIDFSTGAKMQLPINDYGGVPMAIGMNAVSLITMLAKLPGDNVVLRFNSPSMAMVIVPKESEEIGEEVVSLIMPVMLNV